MIAESKDWDYFLEMEITILLYEYLYSTTILKSMEKIILKRQERWEVTVHEDLICYLFLWKKNFFFLRDKNFNKRSNHH